MTIREQFERLTEDTWRKNHPFSEDMAAAAKVLNYPYARNYEREAALTGWLQRFQSCRFGRLAASQRAIRYRILTGNDLRKADAEIEEMIRAELTIWKQLAATGGARSPHSFLLLLAAPEIEYAAPDSALEQLARSVAELLAPNAKEDIAGNDIRTQQLYLEHPSDEKYYAFDVILDFFASAGDGRWWHDHRMPGGIGFTLNSVGHMVRNQEWYEDKGSRTEWAVRTAMTTIDEAAETNDGKATWLNPLSSGKTRKEAACPFADPGKLPGALQDKDWTVYAGRYETDHSVRAEFFDGSNEAADRRRDAFLLDFSYMYRHGREADVALIGGLPVEPTTVYAQIGHPDGWRFVSRSAESLGQTEPPRPAQASEEMAAALRAMAGWRLTDPEVESLING